MTRDSQPGPPCRPAAPTAPSPGQGANGIPAATVMRWVDELATSGLPDNDAERVELLSALERLSNAARATQARVTVGLDSSQRSAQAADGVPAARRGRGIAGQVALARQESPHRGQQLHQLALVLDRELPATADAFRRGLLSQRRAQIIARETAVLTAAHRARVDREVAGDPDRLAGKGDRALAGECARWAARLDPASVVARRRRAERERHVGLRPAPDTMSRLSALLPVTTGVAVYGALVGAADAARAQGDPRSRGQVMADTLVARILGSDARSSGRAAGAQHRPTRAGGTPAGGGAPISWEDCDIARPPAAHDSRTRHDSPTTPTAGHDPATDSLPSSLPESVGVVLNVVLTDAQLFGDADGAAWLDGHGPVDAELARELAHHGRARVRRAFADPATGSLVGLESGSRLFPAGLRSLVRLRDGSCRTPWCDAPVRHIDHVTAHRDGGATTFRNGQGLCESCDYTKQAPGWTAEPVPAAPPGQPAGTPHDVVTTTPTGHRYRSPTPSRVAPATAGSGSTVPTVELYLPPFAVEVVLAA